MRKILILVASQANLPFIRSAKESGYYVITCDNNPLNPGHKIANETIIIDVHDGQRILDKIKNKDIDLVASFVSQHGLKTASFISDALKLDSYPISSLEILMNKGKFRKYLKANNLTYPPFQHIKSLDEIVWSDIIFPSIIKPADSGGSRGVKIMNSKEDILDNFLFAQNNSPTEEVIIEQYLEKGKLINGDCLVSDGAIVGSIIGEYIFDRDLSSVLPIATIFPTKENFDPLRKQLTKLINYLKFPNGIFNFEAIIKYDKYYIIEINPRPSGNYLWKLMGYQYNTDILKDLLHIMLHIKSNYERKQNSKKYAYQIIYTKEEKRYKRPIWPMELRSIVKDTIEFKKPGEIIKSFHSLYDRVAVALLEMENEEENQIYRKNLNRFKI